MIYFIYGSDHEKARKKKNELLRIMLGKRPNAEIFTLTADNFTEAALQSLSASQGLFEQKHIVVLDKVLVEKESKETLLDALPQLAASSSAFLILEGGLDTRVVARIEKHTEKIFAFDEKKKSEWNNNINFLFADAFGVKDKRGAWVFFQKALRAGASAEEVHGTLFWQVKTILLAQKTHNATEADLKPFVYGKAARFAKNFSEGELDNILSRLVDMYHRIRLEGGDLGLEMERFLLTL